MKNSDILFCFMVVLGLIGCQNDFSGRMSKETVLNARQQEQFFEKEED